ncbi:hypothetical protein NPIL_398511 [Nephila pilipes]|uniref:Uncharacterized protein n=1 Tax=Nephila pilipes TaxID=299642 RepID=A0A8X6MN59_NEPPI|nr:hypothetical protein NPIL_398511 [Nephila pilipes]
MNAASNSEDDEDEDNSFTDAYKAHLKKNRNIIESWKWQKNPFNKTKQAPRNICIHVPVIIGRAKDLTDILDTLSDDLRHIHLKGSENKPPRTIVAHEQYGVSSVIVWGMISLHVLGSLVPVGKWPE